MAYKAIAKRNLEMNIISYFFFHEKQTYVVGYHEKRLAGATICGVWSRYSVSVRTFRVIVVSLRLVIPIEIVSVSSMDCQLPGYESEISNSDCVSRLSSSFLKRLLYGEWNYWNNLK